MRSHTVRVAALGAVALALAPACRSDDSGVGPGGDGGNGDAARDGKKNPGANCARNDDCVSGFCVDGACCNTACAGACVGCRTVGRVGFCWPTEAGAPDPRATCKDAGAVSCGQTGACDGSGGCAKYPAGTACKPPACSGTTLTAPGTCDGSGSCAAGGSVDCAPYTCGSGACRSSCSSDADCVAGVPCIGGSCGKKTMGQSCADPGECATGFCVDGICCQSACTGPCRRCDASALPGRCVPLPPGSPDPRGLCTDLGPVSCGANGKCNGSGGCQVYKAGTACGAPETCSGSTHKLPDTCDGMGSCKPGGTLSCAPFACNGSTCFTSCDGNEDCVAPNLCIMGSCGKKPNGAACSAPGECGSGLCEQGVCCGSACFGPCKSCALPSSPGTCSAVAPGGADPRGICKDMGPASCGFTGKCDGAGACTRYPTGTVCKPASCPAGSSTLQPPSTCDGAGRCADATPQSCAPYRCDGVDACRSGCTDDGQCVPPATCMKGSCGKKPLGQPCGGAGECDSSNCVNGVCCATAACGKCQSCAVPGSEGACKNIPAGSPDTSGNCTDGGAIKCGDNGKCDGAGHCQIYGAGTSCGTDVCAEGGEPTLLARECDGLGACKAKEKEDCCPFVCVSDAGGGAAACASACGGPGSAGCACGAVCTGSTCTVPPELPLEPPPDAPPDLVPDDPPDGGTDGPDPD